MLQGAAFKILFKRERYRETTDGNKSRLKSVATHQEGSADENLFSEMPHPENWHYSWKFRKKPNSTSTMRLLTWNLIRNLMKKFLKLDSEFMVVLRSRASMSWRMQKNPAKFCRQKIMVDFVWTNCCRPTGEQDQLRFALHVFLYEKVGIKLASW